MRQRGWFPGRGHDGRRGARRDDPGDPDPSLTLLEAGRGEKRLYATDALPVTSCQLGSGWSDSKRSDQSTSLNSTSAPSGPRF